MIFIVSLKFTQIIPLFLMKISVYSLSYLALFIIFLFQIFKERKLQRNSIFDICILIFLILIILTKSLIYNLPETILSDSDKRKIIFRILNIVLYNDNNLNWLSSFLIDSINLVIHLLFLLLRSCIEYNKLIIIAENKIKINSILFQLLNTALLSYLLMNDFTICHIMALAQLMLNLFLLPLDYNEINLYKRIGKFRIILNISSILFIQIVNFPSIVDLLKIQETLINDYFSYENFTAIFNILDSSTKKNYIFYAIYVICLLIEGFNYKILTFKPYDSELENEILEISISDNKSSGENQVLILLNAEDKYYIDNLFSFNEEQIKGVFKQINNLNNETNIEKSNYIDSNILKNDKPNNNQNKDKSWVDFLSKFRIDLFYYKENILRMSIILLVILIHNIFSIFYVFIFILTIICSMNNFILNYLTAFNIYFNILIFSLSYSYPEILKYNENEIPSFYKNIKYVLDYSSDLTLFTKILMIFLIIPINLLIFNVKQFDSKTAKQEINNKPQLKEKFVKEYRANKKTQIEMTFIDKEKSFETNFIEKEYIKNNMIAKGLVTYFSKFFTLFVLPFFSHNNFYHLGKNYLLFKI